MGVVGGPASTFNPYLYVRGNPVNLTDPSERIAPLIAAALFVGAATLIGGLLASSTVLQAISTNNCSATAEIGNV